MMRCYDKMAKDTINELNRNYAGAAIAHYFSKEKLSSEDIQTVGAILEAGDLPPKNAKGKINPYTALALLEFYQSKDPRRTTAGQRALLTAQAGNEALRKANIEDIVGSTFGATIRDPELLEAIVSKIGNKKYEDVQKSIVKYQAEAGVLDAQRDKDLAEAGNDEEKQEEINKKYEESSRKLLEKYKEDIEANNAVGRIVSPRYAVTQSNVLLRKQYLGYNNEELLEAGKQPLEVDVNKI